MDRRIAHDDCVHDVVRLGADGLAHAGRKLVESFGEQPGHGRCLIRPLVRVYQPGDDVLAVRDLRVHRTVRGQGPARRQVHDVRGDLGRADVDRQPQPGHAGRGDVDHLAATQRDTRPANPTSALGGGVARHSQVGQDCIIAARRSHRFAEALIIPAGGPPASAGPFPRRSLLPMAGPRPIPRGPPPGVRCSAVNDSGGTCTRQSLERFGQAGQAIALRIASAAASSALLVQDHGGQLARDELHPTAAAGTIPAADARQVHAQASAPVRAGCRPAGTRPAA